MISSGLDVRERAGNSYVVEQHAHGVIIRGAIPVTDFCALGKSASARGFDYLDAGIGCALGHVTVFTNEEHGNLWRAEIEAKLIMRHPGDVERQWFYGCDTGTSSVTIFVALASFVGTMHLPPTWRADVPHDPADFGRCYRLLEKLSVVSEIIEKPWRERLGEVAEKYPIWAPFVREWTNLEALWVEEVPSGNCPKLYEAIKALQKERKP